MCGVSKTDHRELALALGCHTMSSFNDLRHEFIALRMGQNNIHAKAGQQGNNGLRN